MQKMLKKLKKLLDIEPGSTSSGSGSGKSGAGVEVRGEKLVGLSGLSWQQGSGGDRDHTASPSSAMVWFRCNQTWPDVQLWLALCRRLRLSPVQMAVGMVQVCSDAAGVFFKRDRFSNTLHHQHAKMEQAGAFASCDC